MDYEQKYKEALEKAREIVNNQQASSVWKDWLCNTFPELKESEDERTRKDIISYLRNEKIVKRYISDIEFDKWIAWLEKQGEPKFKVGDWCIDNEDDTIFQIVKVLDNTYTYRTNEGKEYSCTHYSLENDVRLFTIQDAKDGDVLVDSLSGNNQITILYKCIELDTSIHAYCGWNGYNFRVTTDGTGYGTLSSTKYVPATKEQRDLLFAKMKEAGYEWDAEKKEPKKIENELEIPFGAKDSELQEVTYYIPKGFHAEIDDDKVVIEKGEKFIVWSKEDEKIRKSIIAILDNYIDDDNTIKPAIMNWLEKQGNNGNQNWKPSKGQINALEHFVRSIEESGYASPYDDNTKLLKSLMNDLYKLEKQGEQKPADKVEPKVEIEKGKWYVCNTHLYQDFVVGKAYYCPKNGMLKPNENAIARYVAGDCFHLWTIADAKDGDVLVTGDYIFIFKYILHGGVHIYCHYDIYDEEFDSEPDAVIGNICDKGVHFHPATKEQRDLLFQKMKEAGYE